MPDKGNPVKGVVLVAGAVFLFALADVLTKRLATAYGVIVVVALLAGVAMVWRTKLAHDAARKGSA